MERFICKSIHTTKSHKQLLNNATRRLGELICALWSLTGVSLFTYANTIAVLGS